MKQSQNGGRLSSLWLFRSSYPGKTEGLVMTKKGDNIENPGCW
jgi:hypothetical protein